MRRNHIALYLSISFTALSAFVFFIDIPHRIFAAISLSSLFYAIAQVSKSYVNYKFDDLNARIDAYSTAKLIDIDEQFRLIFKKALPMLHQPKKAKALNFITCVFELLGVVTMVLGIIIPIPALENEKVSAVSTVLSYAGVFLSISLVEKSAERKEQWELVQLFSLSMNQQAATAVTKEPSHGEA